MNENTMTNAIIHYLHYHRNMTTFDVKSFHDREFRETNYDSFRKIISRLAKQGEITHLGLTLYYNGKIDEDLRYQAVLDYYINEKHGYYSGEALLYDLNIIDEPPRVFEIKCNVNRGVTCYDVKAIPFGKRGVGKRLAMLQFYTLCELARIEKQVDDDHYDRLIGVMVGLATDIHYEFLKHGRLAFGIDAPFPRYIYFKVANFLQRFDLYNEVIEWYESLQERETGKNVQRIPKIQ